MARTEKRLLTLYLSTKAPSGMIMRTAVNVVLRLLRGFLLCELVLSLVACQALQIAFNHEQCSPPGPSASGQAIVKGYESLQSRTKLDDQPPEPKSHAEWVKVWIRNIRDRIEVGDMSYKDFTFIPLTFYSSHYATKFKQVMSVPSEHLWCILRPGDVVLLSDGITHHYTLIYDVDRVRNHMRILDPWPAKFFLKNGKNGLGIAAKEVLTKSDLRPSGIIHFELSRDDLLRTLVSVSTYDDGKLLTAYWGMYQTSANQPEVNLAAGLSYYENPSLYLFDARLTSIESASLYLKKAKDLYGSHRQANSELFAASKLHAVLSLKRHLVQVEKNELSSQVSEYLPLMDRLAQIERRRPEARRAVDLRLRQTEDEIKGLEDRYGKEAVLSNYDADDYFKVGFMSYLEAPPRAIGLFDKAIELNNQHFEAYLLRAKVKYETNEFNGAVQDATKALELATKEEDEVLTPILTIRDKGTRSFLAEQNGMRLNTLRRIP